MTYVRPAVERAVQDLIHPVVERSVKIAATTAEHIIKKVEKEKGIAQFCNVLLLFVSGFCSGPGRGSHENRRPSHGPSFDCWNGHDHVPRTALYEHQQ